MTVYHGRWSSTTSFVPLSELLVQITRHLPLSKAAVRAYNAKVIPMKKTVEDGAVGADKGKSFL
jgi:hypothetical protein